MRIESTRVAPRTRFQHAAGFFATTTHLVEQALPIVQTALARGEPVVIALRPRTERALLHAVSSATGVISYAERDSVQSGSAQTTATRRARELRGLARDFGTATVLSEHTPRLDGLDGSFWTELDAALNVACADAPISLTCFYPEIPLHQRILTGARRNHPLLLVDGTLCHNPDHRPPHEVLAEMPPAHPPLLGPPDLRLPFRSWQLYEVRTTVERMLLAAGHDASRAEDIVLAVNEVATNAVEHGALEAQLLVWNDRDGLTCEVYSSGGGVADPLSGLRAPRPGEDDDRGMWIARQLCDLLQVWTDQWGTHVRMRVVR